ncbi:cell growth-regulating nucleolar protein [Cololabis saira]|uniref:cell growth-regulating nucleolar protein n=1 Tax=Cololabis saira TaxID=129043 RepID=UPI002AD29FEB|nr:cell growth-regulating nucleolar protein [Cololabis saira]
MVFFTCNACGESLKKAQVDKHVNMCRGCQVLSCIDCGKDFWGDDYKNHNKCISEDQKYGGKGYEAKANKGDVKQQQWIQKIQDAMNKPGVSAKLKDVLGQVSTYDNVPRKKAKFQNWMRNSMKISNTSLHDEVWNILSAADDVSEVTQQSVENKETAASIQVSTNGSDQPNTEGKKKKLNKRERKEARQQKNGKAEKCVEKTGKRKKDRNTKCDSEEVNDEEQDDSGCEYETSAKKSKITEPAEADEQETEETEDTAARGNMAKYDLNGCAAAAESYNKTVCSFRMNWCRLLSG